MYRAVLAERDIFHAVMATQLPKWKKEGHLLHRKKKKKKSMRSFITLLTTIIYPKSFLCLV